MMLHPQQQQHFGASANSLAPSTDAASLARHSKRKAADAPDSNERLSKRLSLLNLDNNGARIYVPVESSRASLSPPPPASALPVTSSPALVASAVPEGASLPAVPAALSTSPVVVPPTQSPIHRPPPTIASTATPQQVRPHAAHKHGTATPDDDGMHVDDTKYKVYIYNIDDELADDEASTSSSDDKGNISSDGPAAGDAERVVLHPDLAKRLRDAARDTALSGTASASTSKKLAIPRPVVPNEDGELAGMQLVLYTDPRSLSLPREQDGVRQAILDARARIRERQDREREEAKQQPPSSPPPIAEASMASTPVPEDEDSDAMDID